MNEGGGMNKPQFAGSECIKIDRLTGRIAIHFGQWYDMCNQEPHIGRSREEAETLLAQWKDTTCFPHFQDGYTVTSSYLDEEQHLIVVICTPKRGLAPVSDEMMKYLNENSIL